MVDEKKSVSPITTNSKTVKTIVRKTTQTTPPVISLTNKNISKPDPRGIKYKNASKRSLSQIIHDTIPKEAIPTRRLGYIFGIVLLIVVVIGIFQFPFGKMLSGSTDIQFEIGMPWDFFVMDLGDPEALPIKPGGLFGDMIIYFIIAYIIDVIINVILNTSLFESKEEKKKHPEYYKEINKNRINNQTVADKATQKVFGLDAPRPANKGGEPIVPTIVGSENQKVTTMKTTSEMLPPKDSETPMIRRKTVIKTKEITNKAPLPPKKAEVSKDKNIRLKGELKKEGDWYVRK